MPEPIAIVGGGPAGMALALALHKQGIASEIYDARPRGAASTDPRVLALAHGSRLTLEWLGAWQGIPHTPIETIHVSHRGGLGRARLSAREEKVPALGYVLSAGALASSLDAAAARAGIVFHENTVISSRQKPVAPLLVWAEGKVEEEAVVTRDYGQHALAFTATPLAPHGNTAWERFTPQGPIAALPHGSDLAVVMTCAAQEAAQVAALDDRAFRNRLQERFGRRITFTGVGPRHVFPLGLRYRPRPVGAREVWIGNAAQTLHPVAGQGFNLALRDIFELARCLANQSDLGDPGAPALLARYAAARKLDRRATIDFTDALARIFGSTASPLRHARGLGLLALDLAPPLRSFLARRMMFGARGW